METVELFGEAGYSSFGSALVEPRLRLLPLRGGLVAVFLFLERSLGVGDLSRLNSETTSTVGGLIVADLDLEV